MCSTARNIPSTYEQLQVVDKYLQVPNVKLGIKEVYQMVPMHPDNWLLLGMH